MTITIVMLLLIALPGIITRAAIHTSQHANKHDQYRSSNHSRHNRRNGLHRPQARTCDNNRRRTHNQLLPPGLSFAPRQHRNRWFVSGRGPTMSNRIPSGRPGLSRRACQPLAIAANINTITNQRQSTTNLQIQTPASSQLTVQSASKQQGRERV